MRECKKCKKLKPLTAFHKHKGCRGGRVPICKACTHARQKAYRAKPDVRVARRKYDHEHRHTPQGRHAYRKAALKYNYGITLAEYEDILAAQNGACSICHGKEPAATKFGKKSLHVDHNHKTGAIRGLLCTNCNLALGNFKDNKQSLLRAIIYLEKHE